MFEINKVPDQHKSLFVCLVFLHSFRFVLPFIGSSLLHWSLVGATSLRCEKNSLVHYGNCSWRRSCCCFHSTSSHASTTFNRRELFVVQNGRTRETINRVSAHSTETSTQQQHQTIEIPFQRSFCLSWVARFRERFRCLCFNGKW